MFGAVFVVSQACGIVSQYVLCCICGFASLGYMCCVILGVCETFPLACQERRSLPCKKTESAPQLFFRHLGVRVRSSFAAGAVGSEAAG